MIWIGVLAVGLGSFAFRAAPLLLGAGFEVPERTQAILRHAGMGGIAALLVSNIVGIGSGMGSTPPRLQLPQWPSARLSPGEVGR